MDNALLLQTKKIQDKVDVKTSTRASQSSIDAVADKVDAINNSTVETNSNLAYYLMDSCNFFTSDKLVGISHKTFSKKWDKGKPDTMFVKCSSSSDANLNTNLNVSNPPYKTLIEVNGPCFLHSLSISAKGAESAQGDTRIKAFFLLSFGSSKRTIVLFDEGGSNATPATFSLTTNSTAMSSPMPNYTYCVYSPWLEGNEFTPNITAKASVKYEYPKSIFCKDGFSLKMISYYYYSGSSDVVNLQVTVNYEV